MDLLAPDLGPRGGARTKGRKDPNKQKRDSGYWLMRLKKDRPDLYEKVQFGELTTNAAAVEAGLRKKTIAVPVDLMDDPLALADFLSKHFSDAERSELALRIHPRPWELWEKRDE